MTNTSSIMKKFLLICFQGTILSQEIKNYPDGLLIQADGDSTHGAVAKLMDKARYAGSKSYIT